MDPAKKLVVGRTTIIKGPILGSSKTQSPPSSSTTMSPVLAPPAKPLLAPMAKAPLSTTKVPLLNLGSTSASAQTPLPAPPSSVFLSSLTDSKPKSARFDHEIACGILVGIFEKPGITVTLESVTMINRETKAPAVKSNWMKDDEVCALAKECVLAKKKLTNPNNLLTTAAFLKSPIAGENENESQFALLRKRMVELLSARGVVERAKDYGCVVV